MASGAYRVIRIWTPRSLGTLDDLENFRHSLDIERFSHYSSQRDFVAHSGDQGLENKVNE